MLVHHASVMVAAILVFAFVGRLVFYLMPHGTIRRALIIIDDVVLIGLMAFFAWELFVYLWNRRERVGEIQRSIPTMLAAARGWIPIATHALRIAVAHCPRLF